MTRAFAQTLCLFLATVACASADNYDDLIANRYLGTVRLQQVGGSYVGLDFKATTTPTTWLLKSGHYKGRLTFVKGSWKGEGVHQDVDLHGYWIYRTDANQCWQVQGGSGGSLVYWNQDGKAHGDPENWELFTFNLVNKSQGTVIIQTSISDFKPLPGWVSLVNNQFACLANQKLYAAVFKVTFLTPTPTAQVQAQPKPQTQPKVQPLPKGPPIFGPQVPGHY